MDLELARRSHALLMQALEREGADRERFVDAACAGDPLLQTQAAALLAALDRSGPLLESPALHRPRGMNIRTALESPQIIHGYRIVRVIGMGGMATVYEAIQERPRRSVALKVLRHGLAQTSALQRFQFETEVLARLQHPGIAQIFEAGAFDDGQGLSIPFFAMEFILDARPITVSASQRDLSLRARLDLFSAVCDAVQFGHQHGVIHRDLKPGNILVDPRGQPRVIDFGIARLSDPAAASITRAEGPGQLVGTLNYMSPEQCAGGAAVDIRTDVYSLGVILYELLCGRLPHDLSRVTLPEALRIVRENVAVRPAAIDPRLKGDIDAIVMTAMEKDPHRRYPTVAALAADIRRFLDDQPIQARPATLIYQIRRFARRHRALVTAALLVVAVLIAAGGWTTWAMLRWRAEAIRAQQAVDKGLVIKAFLEEIVASPDPATGQAEVRFVDVLRDASADVAERFANHPEVEADLRFVLARGFDNLALFPDALVHARRADELYRGLLPPDHPRALEAANSLAWLLYRARELDQATAIAQDVIARTAGKPALTSAHVTAQRAIASVLIFRDDYSAAEALLRAALETTHSTLGPSHGETLLAINDLAVLFQSRARRQLSPDPEKDLQDAVDLLSVALPAFIARFGEDGRHTLLVMLNLAGNLLRQQRFAEAESYAVRVLALTPRRYGRDHGFCIGALGLLSEIQFGQRKFAAAAQAAIQQVESLRRMTGGKQTAALLAAMSEALSILDAAGELETGAEYARTLHDAFSAMGSHAGTSTLEYAVYRARFLSRQGKREEADAIFAEVDGNDRDLPELLRWQIELSLGGHAAMSGRFEEAESRLLSVAASASGSWLILSQQELARLYEAFGNAEEADRWNALANTPSVAP